MEPRLYVGCLVNLQAVIVVFVIFPNHRENFMFCVQRELLLFRRNFSRLRS